MKSTTHIPGWLIAASAAAAMFTFTATAGDKPKKEKGIFHLSIQERMVNEGALAAARGKAQIQLDQENQKAAHQKVKLHIDGLDSSATYQLAAQVDDDTNLTQIATFTPDHEGKANIELREKGPKHPDSKYGHVHAQLPPELQPVTLIHQLLVSDTNGATVLSADLTSPDKFEYLVKADLSSGDIRAKLGIKANSHKGQVHLDAKGLEAGSDYSLALNGTVAGSATADHEGKVNLRAELQNVADIFALETVELLDASSTAVVSATVQ